MQGSQSLPDVGISSHIPIAGHDIGIKEMYNIAMRNNSAWGVEGYQVPAAYHDSRKIAEAKSGKFKRPAPRALKNLDYLTSHLAVAKTIPAPNHYNIVKPWATDKDKKSAPKYVTKKHSYIDTIIQEGIKRPTPGPGAHNLRETDEQAKKKIKKGEVKGSGRTNFLMEYEYVASFTPGPGNYNPRQIQPKLKEVKMKPEDWKKKHNEQRSKSAKSSFPDVGTYNHMPVAYKTFGKLYDQTKNKTNQTKVKEWGTATRFELKKDNKKDPNNFPGPGQYNMTAEWSGKALTGKTDTKDKNWMNKITKGIEKSIYYS
jgi:hypothetical protein